MGIWHKLFGRGAKPAAGDGSANAAGSIGDESMDDMIGAALTMAINKDRGETIHEVLYGDEGDVAGLWIKDKTLLDNEMFLRMCVAQEKIPGDAGLAAFINVSEKDYRIVDNSSGSRGGCYVMMGSALAPGESVPQLEACRWQRGEENPVSADVNTRFGDSQVRYDCPTCGVPVRCPYESIHPVVGAMVECPTCGNVSHVSPLDQNGDFADRLEASVCACVLVPIDEFSDWYFAHPVCEGADPAIEASYGLWAYCARCKHQFSSSVLFSVAMTDSVGSMIFNANSPESAQDFNALTEGHCPDCGHGNLLALRTRAPERIRTAIQEMLGGS